MIRANSKKLNIHIGNRLYLLRKAANLTQKEAENFEWIEVNVPLPIKGIYFAK